MKQSLTDDKAPSAAMQIVQDCLVISVQIELYEATLVQLREDLLQQINKTGVRKAIFDFSSVDLIDAYAYNAICDIATMARIMGTETLISGIRPGVASALVELGVDVGRIDTALNLEEGIVQLATRAAMEDVPDDEQTVVDMDKGALRELIASAGRVAEVPADDDTVSELDERILS